MGFFYRKSIKMGPFRVNVSKSGLGYSVGGRGFRVGRSGSGRKYTAFSVPGTGVGYRKYGSGCLVLSEHTGATRLDGLKVWPNDSELVEFGALGWNNLKNEQPTLWDGLFRKI